MTTAPTDNLNRATLENTQQTQQTPPQHPQQQTQHPQQNEPILLNDILQLDAAAEKLLNVRPDVVRYLAESYRALYVEDQALSRSVRHALAAIAARRQGNEVLAQHHGALADATLVGEELPQDLKIEAIIEHVDLITVSPGLVAREDQYTLQLAGVTPEEIVLISQIVAYTSTLARVIDGYTLLAGGTPQVSAPLARPTVAAGRPVVPVERTVRGSHIPTQFTTDELDWEPWVTPPSIDELTDTQRDSFASRAANSEYFRLLALVPNVLAARTALDNAIFLGKSGLPRGERELAAAVTSKVNGCIYCASVHARRAAFQTKRPDDVARLLAVALTRDENWLPGNVEKLAQGQDERWSALIVLTARLSQLVPQASAADVERLARAGLTPEQIGDAVLAAAFFSWANRLMLSLGEPAIPGTSLQ